MASLDSQLSLLKFCVYQDQILLRMEIHGILRPNLIEAGNLLTVETNTSQDWTKDVYTDLSVIIKTISLACLIYYPPSKQIRK